MTHARIPPRPAGAPALIAHRGLPRECPENTLAGFQAALALGVDALELDVHATADEVVVVHHDAVLSHGARAGSRIDRLTWRELREAAGEATPVPRLDEVLALASGSATVHVEVKAPAIERAVLRAIRGARARCEVHAFDHRIAATVRKLAPDIGVGILQASRLVDSGAALRAAGAAALWQEWTQVDAGLVREATAAGARVIAWTVNDADAARQFAAWGVAGLCTDTPAEIARALGRE